MTDENKALIGRRCAVEYDGNREHGTIVGVVESVKISAEIILYKVELDIETWVNRHPRTDNWLGFGEVELIGGDDAVCT